jgi:hypothetical protein
VELNGVFKSCIADLSVLHRASTGFSRRALPCTTATMPVIWMTRLQTSNRHTFLVADRMDHSLNVHPLTQGHLNTSATLHIHATVA